MNAKRVGENVDYVKTANTVSKRRGESLSPSMLGIGNIFQQKLAVADEAEDRIALLRKRLEDEEAKKS